MPFIKTNLRSELAARLGLPADTDQAQLLTALDQALAFRPEGTELVDSEVFAQLRADAERGRVAREAMLVEAAIRDGRITPASRTTWITNLQTDPGAEQLLASLQRNSIPVRMVGYGQDLDDSTSDEKLLRQLFPDT
jgi:hypothetical protein